MSDPTTAPTTTTNAGRRVLLGGGLAAMATGATLLTAGRAESAPPTAAWVCGGNTNITTDGTNYLGTKNVAPLVFKTADTANTPLERMRITPAGKVGVGLTAPVAVLDALTATSTAIRGNVTSNGAGAIGVRGLTKNGAGVSGEASINGKGVSGTSPFVGVYGHGDNTSVWGDGGVYGVYGSGSSYGVYGVSGSGYGAFGSGPDYGVVGSGDTGVYGSGSTYGTYGSGFYGVFGSGSVGVRGDGGASIGVEAVGGRAMNAIGSSSGLYATSPSRPVEAQAVGGGSEGVALFADTRGSTASANKYAGYFVGDTIVFGTLSKSAGSFKIDHPLAPEEKWLSHSFVESPDMMNVYNGNVVCGADGTADVALPDYFTALNRDYRYQLTCIGGHAPVYVSSKVSKNRFSIAGGTPGLEVSWQVTGIRQDAYAKAHPILVEEAKAGTAKGGLAFVPAGSGARSALISPSKPPVVSSAPAPLDLNLEAPVPGG